MKKVAFVFLLALFAMVYNPVNAGCENTGNPSGICSTEYGSTTGHKMCYTSSSSPNCTGSTNNESLD
jgi:hypothetical protein